MNKISILLIFSSLTMFANELYFYQNGKKIFVEKLKNKTKENNYNLKSIDSKYKINNKNVIIQPMVIAKIKNGDLPNDIFYGYTFENIYGNVYKIYVSNDIEAISLSSKLYESNMVEYANPNIKRSINEK